MLPEVFALVNVTALWWEHLQRGLCALAKGSLSNSSFKALKYNLVELVF